MVPTPPGAQAEDFVKVGLGLGEAGAPDSGGYCFGGHQDEQRMKLIVPHCCTKRHLRLRREQKDPSGPREPSLALEGPFGQGFILRERG